MIEVLKYGILILINVNIVYLDIMMMFLVLFKANKGKIFSIQVAMTELLKFGTLIKKNVLKHCKDMKILFLIFA